jgi:hypothetical protein
MSNLGVQRSEEFWAIAAYFNPAGSRRRLANYRIFRKHLIVPLLAVELAYGPDFELGNGDADLLIQLRGTDVMWQKERLLNLAVQALPPCCSKVAWLDCDVVFESAEWAEKTTRRLDEVPLLQPFARVHYLAEDLVEERLDPAFAVLTRHSIATFAACGLPIICWSPPSAKPSDRPGVGFAWAARRELVQRFGLFDACIVGGGDRAIIAAADGNFAGLMDMQHMNEAQRRRYFDWAVPFHAATGAADNFVDGDLYNLWHGNERGRQYRDRHSGLGSFAFDPFADIAIADNGAWRWNSDKPDMHDYVRSYLMSRAEDG